MRLSECPIEEFERRPLKSATKFGDDGIPLYTITIIDGKLHIDNKYFAKQFADHTVIYQAIPYGIDNPQMWLHGFIFESGTYSRTEFEFAD